MKLKRLCLFIIAIFLVVFVSGVHADELQDEIISGKKLIELLTGDALEQSEAISRKDFVKYVCKLIKLNIPETAEQIFDDVAAEDDFNTYLKAAVDRGLINAGGNFMPEDAITTDEAVTIAIRATGYQKLAEIRGGYPYGYRNVAKDAYILENLSLNGDFNTDKCSLLLQNMMLADVMEYRSEDYDVVKGKTLFNVLYDGNIDEGILSANDVTSIGVGGSELPKLNAKIGDAVYRFGKEYEKYIRKYIGYNVRVFYNENHNDVLLMLPYNNDRVEFNNADVELKDNTLSIEVDKKTRKYKLDYGYSLIYNGKNEPVIYDDILNFDSGNITLVDNDDDNVYEVIFVESYIYFKAGKVNTINMTIPDITDGKNSVDLSANDCVYEIYSPDDGMYINLKDIPENSYIAVRKSTDGKFVYIELCQNSILGKVVSQDDDFVKIGETEYRYSDSFKRFYLSSAGGIEGIFYLGINGEVIAFEKKGDTWLYGYLQKVLYDEDAETIIVKIFDQMGLWGTYTLNESISIDRRLVKYKSNVENTYNEINAHKGSLIKFIAADGILKKLDLSEDATEYGECLNMDEGDNFIKYNFTTDGYYYTSSSQLFYPHFSSKGSIVFSIPDDKENIRKYKITTSSIFTDKTTYTVVPYDVDMYGVAAVILYDNTAGSVDYNMNGSSVKHMIIEEVLRVVDEDDEIRTMINGWSGGKFVSYIIGEDAEIQKETEKNELVPGDLIKYHLQDDKTIDCIIVDFDAEKFEKNSGIDTSAYNTGEKNVMQLSGGLVYSIGSESITILPDSYDYDYAWNKIRCIPFTASDKNIVIFNRKNKTLRPGSREDINGYREFGEAASFVVIRQNYLAGQYVFVYEN